MKKLGLSLLLCFVSVSAFAIGPLFNSIVPPAPIQAVPVMPPWQAKALGGFPGAFLVHEQTVTAIVKGSLVDGKPSGWWLLFGQAVPSDTPFVVIDVFTDENALTDCTALKYAYCGLNLTQLNATQSLESFHLYLNAKDIEAIKHAKTLTLLVADKTDFSRKFRIERDLTGIVAALDRVESGKVNPVRK